MNDSVLRVVSRIVIPFAIVYGSYVTVYGHLSPGGGFPGGALLAAAVILYTLALDRSAENYSHAVSERIESGALLVYIVIGVVGVLLANSFLSNLSTGVPAGRMGTLLSAGFIPVIGVAIGAKVANTVLRFFRSMVEEESDQL